MEGAEGGVGRAVCEVAGGAFEGGCGCNGDASEEYVQEGL